MRDTQREGTRRDTLNIRIKPEVRGLIDRGRTALYIEGDAGRWHDGRY